MAAGCTPLMLYYIEVFAPIMMNLCVERPLAQLTVLRCRKRQGKFYCPAVTQICRPSISNNLEDKLIIEQRPVHVVFFPRIFCLYGKKEPIMFHTGMMSEAYYEQAKHILCAEVDRRRHLLRNDSLLKLQSLRNHIEAVRQWTPRYRYRQ